MVRFMEEEYPHGRREFLGPVPKDAGRVYCRECGRMMERVFYQEGYSPSTGEPLVALVIACYGGSWLRRRFDIPHRGDERITGGIFPDRAEEIRAAVAEEES